MLRLLVVSLLTAVAGFFNPALCVADDRVAKRSADNQMLSVAVASNFRFAAEQLAADFEAASGITVQLSSASTGVLAAQLRRGAPFDVLLGADKDRPQALHDQKLSSGPARCYAQGSLVLLGAGSLEVLTTNPGARIAIANPRTAPYGVAALAVLDDMGFKPKQERLISGTNVLQALQFYQSGAVEYALVARSLSLNEGVPVPLKMHAAIAQYAIIAASSTRIAQANAFLDYLRSPIVEARLPALGYQTCS